MKTQYVVMLLFISGCTIYLEPIEPPKREQSKPEISKYNQLLEIDSENIAIKEDICNYEKAIRNTQDDIDLDIGSSIREMDDDFERDNYLE